MISKRSKPCIAVLCGFLCIAATTAIGQPKPSEEPPRRLKLIFITCCVDQTFFGPVKKGMQDAADMLDVDCEFVGTPGVDLKAQAKLVRKAIAEGYDGIAINLIDPVALDEVVAEAVERGIPVVAFNVDDSTTPSARLASVSQHFLEAGRKLAERALADVPQNAHVLMTKHDDGVSALEDRLRGMQEVLAEHGVTWTTIVTGNESEKGATVVARALQRHPDVHIVFSSGQSDTEAVGRALESDFPNHGYWSAGFDLSPKTLQLVRDGHIRYIVDQQPYAQGFYPVTALVLKLRYGIAPADMDAGAAIIDRSNVDQLLDLTSKGYR